VGHFGPRGSKWATNSRVNPVDYREMARLYLAFASFGWTHLLQRRRGRWDHRTRLCRCSAHPLVSTDAFDLSRRVAPRRRSRCPCAGPATLSQRVSSTSASAILLVLDVVERPRRHRHTCGRTSPSGTGTRRLGPPSRAFPSARGAPASRSEQGMKLATTTSGWNRDPFRVLPIRTALLCVRQRERTHAAAPRRASSTASCSRSSRRS